MPPNGVLAREEGGKHPQGKSGGGGGKLPFLGHGRVGRLMGGGDAAATQHRHHLHGSEWDGADEAPGGTGGGAQWASLPMELLVEVIRRVEEREGSWPGRREVVTCAAVCRSWREATSEVVCSVEKSGIITFPISLKQPGPRDSPIQCFIRRERTSSTYYLYMGLSPVLLTDSGKFLLAARKMRRPTSFEFVISLANDDFSRASSMYVGKLRTNFLGTKYTVYDNQPPSDIVVASSSRSSNRRIHYKQVSPRVSAGNYRIATISYEINVLRSRGPRRMQCTMDTIPLSATQRDATPPTSAFPRLSLEQDSSPLQAPRAKDAVLTFCSRRSPGGSSSLRNNTGFEPLVLKNKAPRWHEQLQCWCLNFRGRVTVASVKNFQLVAAVERSHTFSAADEEKVILQFGKIGKDIFTMDYLYPLSAFQAFAICLSSFDTKPACE